MSDDEKLPTPPTEVISGAATRSDYAEAICDTYRQTVEGIFRMGDLLKEAKEELPYGEFGSMVEEDLPFGPRTARRLMRIARDNRLRNRTNASDLPPAWTTLHSLTKLDDSEWAAIEPHLSPELISSEIPDLVAKGAQLQIMPDEKRGAREALEAAVKNLPPGERNWLKRRLQRSGTSLVTAVRVAKTFAGAEPGERAQLIELGEVEPPPKNREEADDVQLVLPGVAEDKRTDLLKWDDRWPFEDGQIEGARSVLTVQALLRWAMALCDRTSANSITEGLWVARSRRKIAKDARRVGEWLTETATQVEGA